MIHYRAGILAVMAAAIAIGIVLEVAPKPKTIDEIVFETVEITTTNGTRCVFLRNVTNDVGVRGFSCDFRGGL